MRVTHLGNGRSVIVRVNDRGPFSDPGNRSGSSDPGGLSDLCRLPARDLAPAHLALDPAQHASHLAVVGYIDFCHAV